jgi:hypothetical protein
MSKPAMTIRFARRHKHLLYSIFGLLWLSGLLWLVFHYFFRVIGVYGEMAHPMEVWWLRLHGLAAFSALVAIGSVATVHVQRGLQLKRNQRSGVIMLLIFFWLGATGYALYYFVSDVNQQWLPWIHWPAGLALPGLLGMHVYYGRLRAHRPSVVVKRHSRQTGNLHPK